VDSAANARGFIIFSQRSSGGLDESDRAVNEEEVTAAGMLRREAPGAGIAGIDRGLPLVGKAPLPIETLPESLHFAAHPHVRDESLACRPTRPPDEAWPLRWRLR
jgi:hypothetical protein